MNLSNLEIQKGFDYLRSLGLTAYISHKNGDIRYAPADLNYSRWIVRYDADEKNFCVITVIRNSPTYPFDFNTYNAIYVKNFEGLQQMTQNALAKIDAAQKQQAVMKKEARIKEIEKAAENFEA